MAGYGAKGIKKVGVYRSGLEEKNMKYLEGKNVIGLYEKWSIPYVIPESSHRYTPDILLPNGIFVELKGLWEADDRKKHMLLREQYPDIEIRFVFSSSRTKIYKGSPTSYGEFCEKRGILFADKLIPVEWIKEPLRVVPFDKLKEKKSQGGN